MYALIERIIEVFYHLYVIAYNNQTRNSEKLSVISQQ